MKNVLSLLIGIYFGIVLIKSELASWFRIQSMFRFEELHMYLVICSAVVVGAVSILLIKWLGQKTVVGDPIEFKEKPFQKGTILGGILFGLGWAITGACPGPMYAQLGSGEYLTLLSFAGAFLGVYVYALLKPKLPH
jgi:uncharacterized protein|tara:strand:- start:186 stop:596 length:411 start_codon:yes stop_codon:yes gene_type:complete